MTIMREIFIKSLIKQNIPWLRKTKLWAGFQDMLIDRERIYWNK